MSSTVKAKKLKVTTGAMQKMMTVLQPLNLNVNMKTMTFNLMKSGNWISLMQRIMRALCSPKVMYYAIKLDTIGQSIHCRRVM